MEQVLRSLSDQYLFHLRTLITSSGCNHSLHFMEWMLQIEMLQITTKTKVYFLELKYSILLFLFFKFSFMASNNRQILMTPKELFRAQFNICIQLLTHSCTSDKPIRHLKLTADLNTFLTIYFSPSWIMDLSDITWNKYESQQIVENS